MPIRRVAKDPDATEGFQILGSDSRLESESIIAGFFHREKKLRSKKDFVATAFVLSLRERKNTTVRSAHRDRLSESAPTMNPVCHLSLSAPSDDPIGAEAVLMPFVRPSEPPRRGRLCGKACCIPPPLRPPNVRASVAHFIRPSVRPSVSREVISPLRATG